MIYPITVEVLHQVFKAYGFVEKIVTFQKSAG
jgi:polypyrimidine tract-binding protein 2